MAVLTMNSCTCIQHQVLDPSHSPQGGGKDEELFSAEELADPSKTTSKAVWLGLTSGGQSRGYASFHMHISFQPVSTQLVMSTLESDSSDDADSDSRRSGDEDRV